MFKVNRDYSLSVVLAIASGLMAVILLVEWIHFHNVRADLEKRLAAKVEVNLATNTQEEETPELPDIEAYSEMTDRPLFIEGRRPPDIEDATADSSLEQTPLTLKLMGVVFTPRDKTALFVDEKGKYKRARQDAVVGGGWKLVEIAQDKVVLTQGEESKELKLLKPKPKIGAPPKTHRGRAQKQNDETADESAVVEEPDAADESAVEEGSDAAEDVPVDEGSDAAEDVPVDEESDVPDESEESVDENIQTDEATDTEQ